jgi:hypothetical protein
MHEQSETIQDKLGRFLNVYGRNTMKAGKPLPKKYDFEQESYPTLEEAVGAAQRRSEEEGKDLERTRRPRGPRSRQQLEYEAAGE